jgi:hypothetical protein
MFTENEDGSGAVIFTLQEFAEACRNNSFTDDDGSAYLGNEIREANRPVSCVNAAAWGPTVTSLTVAGRELNHVWWYGK